MGTGKAHSLDKQDLKRGQEVSGLRSGALKSAATLGGQSASQTNSLQHEFYLVQECPASSRLFLRQ